MKIFALSLIIALFGLVFPPVYSGAQIQNLNPADTLSVNINPETPGPNESVTISIESYSFDLNQARIVWILNSKPVKDKIGDKKLTFTTAGAGLATHVEVLIDPPGLIPFKKDWSFYSASVDLIFQAKTFTPPFYKGKSYFSDEATVVVAAVPTFFDQSGKKIDPGALTYTWKKNGDVVGDVSGRGQNSITFLGDYFGGKETISVDVVSADKKIKATGSVTLEPKVPIVLIYENNPLTGTNYNKAINTSFDLQEKEISFIAVPYYFSNPEQLQYIWKLNGNTAVSAEKEIITLRNDNGDKGKSFLSLDITSPLKHFQNASMGFTVNLQ